MNPFLHGILYMAGYGIAAALIMAFALGLLIKIWDWITPINEWEELRKGNLAVAIIGDQSLNRLLQQPLGHCRCAGNAVRLTAQDIARSRRFFVHRHVQERF